MPLRGWELFDRYVAWQQEVSRELGEPLPTQQRILGAILVDFLETHAADIDHAHESAAHRRGLRIIAAVTGLDPSRAFSQFRGARGGGPRSRDGDGRDDDD